MQYYTEETTRLVFGLHDNRCFRCYGNKTIHIHHISSMDEGRISSLVPLCDSCLKYVVTNKLTTKREIDSYGYEPKSRGRTPGAIRAEIVKENGGSHTDKQFRDLCKKYGNKCINPNCKTPNAKLTADHVIPVTWENSTNYIENIQPLCKSCNSSKGNRSAIDYR